MPTITLALDPPRQALFHAIQTGRSYASQLCLNHRAVYCNETCQPDYRTDLETSGPEVIVGRIDDFIKRSNFLVGT